MYNMEDFINKGEVIGEGCFKKVYRLGDYICAVPIDDNYWSTDQILTQIDVWEMFSRDEEKAKLLCPIIEYDYNYPYYIAPYCKPNIEENSIYTNDKIYHVLDKKDVGVLTSNDNPGYPLEGDLVIATNQGILNGKVVIIDYGLTAESYFNWKLDEEGISYWEIENDNTKDGNKFIKIDFMVDGNKASTLYGEFIDDTIYVDDIKTYSGFYLTDIDEVILDDVADSYIVKDRRTSKIIKELKEISLNIV